MTMQQVYKALSDPTRRRILQLLRQGDMTAGELARHFELSKPTLSRHFGVLREAGLIHGDKQGATITYRLNVSVLEELLMEFMGSFQVGSEEVGSEEEPLKWTASKPKRN
jgi:DNA-binding transcriptional ArsR family regulator